MLLESLKTIFKRDLTKLVKEVELYSDECNLWKIDKGISNPAGNLCLHLVGNLNTYIGAALGNTGYIRQRELEFSLKNVTKKELIAQIENTADVVNSTLNNLSNDDMIKTFPILVYKEATTTEYMLIHLTTHLSYHLGQVNYHRRLLDN